MKKKLEQNMYQIKHYVCSLNLSKISPRTIFFSKSGMTRLSVTDIGTWEVYKAAPAVLYLHHHVMQDNDGEAVKLMYITWYLKVCVLT